MTLCSARIPQDPDPDRATVVIHARLDGPGDELHSCEIEGGPAIHPEVTRRLGCHGRIQVVLEDRAGHVARSGGFIPTGHGTAPGPGRRPRESNQSVHWQEGASELSNTFVPWSDSVSQRAPALRYPPLEVRPGAERLSGPGPMPRT